MKVKNIKQVIKEYFFVNPNSKLRVRQIEKALNLPLPSVIRYCKELKNESIMKTIKTSGVVFYTSDRANENFILEKKIYNIKQLYVSGVVGYLKEELHNPAIVVFGSYAKGEDTEESDIDLYIETISKKDINLKNFEKNLQRKIQVFKFTSLKGVNHHLANNIINGIVLNGFVEAFR